MNDVYYAATSVSVIEIGEEHHESSRQSNQRHQSAKQLHQSKNQHQSPTPNDNQNSYQKRDSVSSSQHSYPYSTNQQHQSTNQQHLSKNQHQSPTPNLKENSHQKRDSVSSSEKSYHYSANQQHRSTKQLHQSAKQQNQSANQQNHPTNPNVYQNRDSVSSAWSTTTTNPGADPVEMDYLGFFEHTRERYKDERDAIQKKTFTKWVNKHLQKAARRVDDLFVDLQDGISLITLLEVLSQETLPREKGRTLFHKKLNVETCLEFLKSKRIKLVNIRAEDIVEGNAKLTLGLIWTIILHFQCQQKDNVCALDYSDNSNFLLQCISCLQCTIVLF